MDPYQEALSRLNNNQKLAVEHLTGPLLVLAGPGTGKTQLLTTKIAYILKNTDLAPENILCLTFTEFGATTMYQRLSSYPFIKKDAYKVNISTYHSFGQSILAAYANYSSDPTPVMDAIDELKKYKIISGIVDSLPHSDILHGDNIRDIISTISEAKRARLTPSDLEKIADENEIDAASLESEISPLLDSIKKGARYPAVAPVYVQILDILSHSLDAPEIFPRISRYGVPLYYSLKDILSALETSEKPSASPLSSWSKKYFEVDSDGHHIIKDRIQGKKLRSVANIMRLYQSYLEQNSLFDFDDMIEKTISILKTDDGFRLTLAEKYQYILLDEFQDTNPSQLEIVELIASATDTPDIMAVGDDDQAIFEFQGARANNFNHFVEHFGAETIVLNENYRSSADVLALSRTIADQIEDSFVRQNSQIDKTLTPRSTRIAADARVTREEFPSSDAEYLWVASEIRRLIDSGVPQSDIAVISPKHALLQPLVAYLAHLSTPTHPIHISYERKDNILEDRKISELLTLAEYLDAVASGDRSSSRFLFEIFNYEFWQIPTISVFSAITSARESKKSALESLAASSCDKLREAAAFLSLLVAKSLNTPLELMLNYLIGSEPVTYLDEQGEKHTFTSPFLSFYSSDASSLDTFEFYDNLSSLRSALTSYVSGSKSPRLHDLVTFKKDHETYGIPVQSTSPYRNVENAVTLTSVHGSKGGEWEHVFCISMDSKSWGKGGGNKNMLVLPPNLMVIRHVGGTDSERLRSLFVAVTRAKSFLTLTSSASNFSGRSLPRLEYLEDSGLEINAHLADATPIAIAAETDLRTFWDSAYFHPSSDFRLALKSIVENYKFSASGVCDFINLRYAGPRVFYDRYILGRPSEFSENALFGSLIHDALRVLTEQRLSDSTILDYFRASVADLDFPDETRARLESDGIEALTATLSVFGEKLRALNSRAEVNLSHEHLHLDDIPLTGKIDHIEINEEKKEIKIFDYKTGAYKDSDWEKDPSLLLYALQLTFYKLLLNLSPTYSRYRVTSGHIIFVTPDKKTGKVYDKVFEYTPAFDDLLRSLIRAISAHLSSLDFLEDPSFMVDPDRGTSAKKILDFIDHVIDTATKD